MSALTRRRLIGWVGLGAAGSLLAACSAATPTPAPTKPAASGPAPTAAASAPTAAATAPTAAATSGAPAAGGAPTQPAAATKPIVEAAKPPTSPPQPGSVKGVLLGAPGRADQMKPLTTRFEAANPGVKGEWLPVQAGSWDEFFGKLVTMFAGGQQLDVIEIALDGIHLFTSRGMVRPLNQLVMAEKDFAQEFFSDVAPPMTAIMMYRGDLYMFPFVWGGSLLYYNPKLFAEAGVDRPKEDWTVEDFLSAAKKINQKNKDVLGYGWTNQTFPGVNHWLMLNDSELFQRSQAPGGEWLWNQFYKDTAGAAKYGGGFLWGEPQANSPRSVEALQFLVDLTHQQKLTPVPTSNWDDLINLFVAKKIGMIVGHRFMISRFKNAGLTPEDFDVTYHPKWKTQRHQYGGSGWAITKDAKQPDNAWLMVKWMTRKDEQAAWIKGGVHTAARRSVTNAPDQNDPSFAPKNWHVYYDIHDKLGDVAPTPSPADAKEITTSLLKYVSLAGGGEMKPKDALDKLQAELVELAARTKR